MCSRLNSCMPTLAASVKLLLLILFNLFIVWPVFVLLGITTVGAAAVFVKIPPRPILNITRKPPPRRIRPINRTSMPFRVGVAIADMTAPITEIAFMGFANKDQVGRGIHTRQWSRAFVIDTNETTLVLVSAEISIVGIALRREVVRNLQKIFGSSKYNLRNVHIGATGTFSAPGGYLGDFMLDMHILGFSREVFFAYCDGITESITKAAKNKKEAYLYYGHTRVWNVNINRAPYAYSANPIEERSRYDSEVDNSLRQIRVSNRTGGVFGVMNWFPIHANSLNVTNYYVSSDNLGFAALKLEEYLNPKKLPGKGSAVAAFFVANAGDVSPNIYGARCARTQADCDNWTLKCGDFDYCRPVGPSGDDMYDSAMMIGNGIYEAAMRVLSLPVEYAFELDDYIVIAHEFVQFSTSMGPLFDPKERRFEWDNDEFRLIWDSTSYFGCKAAIGDHYQYGTLDGPTYVRKYGKYYFGGNVLLDQIRDSIQSRRWNDDICQMPKKEMLFTGRAHYPIPYHHRSSLFVINIGGIYLVGVGAEPTTMAGRRMRFITANRANADESFVIVMGNVNEYSHFIVTRQEYYIQNFESAATLYGRRTLDILLYKLYSYLVTDSNSLELESKFYGSEPEYFKDQALSTVIPAKMDRTIFNRSFGFVLKQPPNLVATESRVKVVFLGANPRNDLKTGKTHFAIEGLVDGNWTDVAYDSDWNTKLFWERIPPKEANGIEGVSHVTITWDVPSEADWGFYRLRYFGAARDELGGLKQFEGVSERFSLSNIE